MKIFNLVLVDTIYYAIIHSILSVNSTNDVSYIAGFPSIFFIFSSFGIGHNIQINALK
ncbi:MAG: hypothetical protein HOO86_10385 [Bacteroidales bacterium]|nr:hypothetical protein [Bacteroidales bacterium]